MVNRKPTDSRDERVSFPYGQTWEEFGSEWVTIEALAEHADEYERYADFAEYLDLETPAPPKIAFATMISQFGLSEEAGNQLTEDCWLVAGLYLTPRRKHELRNGLSANRDLFAEVANHSRKLFRLTTKITSRLDALMTHVRATEPDVIDKAGPSLNDYMRSMHDLALIAERITKQITPSAPGRKPEHLRDTTIRLAIESAKRAGLSDLTISRGTNAEPQPHLKGQAGEFVRGFFALVAPKKNEASLVPAIERVRRQMKKTSKRGT